MWSGPRNISTAMMRSFGNRPDTAVCDEPLYAHYLTRVAVDHPGADEVVARHETDWRAVVAFLTGPVPGGKAVFYQKHMAHHLLPEIDRGFLGALDNAFLIRDPGPMLVSLAKRMGRPTLADTGLDLEVEIFEQVCRDTGRIPPVVDARDVLLDPERTLRALCAALDLEFLADMLRWPPGRRPTDGVWAEHWYRDVEASTGFRPYREPTDPVPEALEPLRRECLERYAMLYAHRLRPAG